MPLKRCEKNGEKGWAYGSGKCFTGPGAKKKAIKMALAEQYNGGEKFTGSEEEMAIAKEIIEEDKSLLEKVTENLLKAAKSDSIPVPYQLRRCTTDKGKAGWLFGDASVCPCFELRMDALDHMLSQDANAINHLEGDDLAIAKEILKKRIN